MIKQFLCTHINEAKVGGQLGLGWPCVTFVSVAFSAAVIQISVFHRKVGKTALGSEMVDGHISQRTKHALMTTAIAATISKVLA
jgi:hypothetical protein